MRHPSQTAPAVMSIDVEDWFHVENLRRSVPRETWMRQQLRVERAMDRMLSRLSESDARATCFVLGWVAERAPRLVRRIAEAGHEVASHGGDHHLVSELTPATFRADVKRSKETLEDITGARVRGYRAPNFSITQWALPILTELGFEYDSSLFPTTIPHSRYGTLPSGAGETNGLSPRSTAVREVSMSCLSLGRYKLPWAGGGYFRLIPYPVFKWGVERIMDSGEPYVFYIHPWELDPEQPRVSGLRRSERLRHYLNLERTEARWAALLRDFEWTTISELLSAQATWTEKRRAWTA